MPTLHAAGTLLLDPEGRALFLLRSGEGDHAGEWCLPGGGAEDGESTQATALRELREETGYDLPADMLMEQPLHVNETDTVHFTTHGGQVPEAFVPKLNDEHSAHAWAPPASPPGPLHPGVAEVLAQLQSGAQDEQDASGDRYSWREGDIQVLETGTQPAPVPDDEEDVDSSTEAVTTIHVYPAEEDA